MDRVQGRPPVNFDDYVSTKELFARGKTAEQISKRLGIPVDVVNKIDRGEIDKYFPKYRPGRI